MYAVIKTGGKQYRVAADDVISVEKLTAAPGDTIDFNDVLMLVGNGDTKVGAPLVSGARVIAEVLEQGRGPKLIHFHKRRRKNSRRKIGHRQDLTTVRILEVLASGQSPSKKATGVGVIPLSQRGRRFETLSAAEGKADDLSLIDGVGPKMLEKLNKAGVFHFWQLAAMTNTEAKAFETKVDFDNRLIREEWPLQARELLAGKPPRAKSDRERADG
jgi:large subunit ribosomal protein L21